MERGLRAKCGILDDVICPNCGALHLKRYNIMSGARGYGKSLQRAADGLNFCNVNCLLEWSKKNGIGETIQND